MNRYIDPIWLYENFKEQAPQFAEKLKNLILVAPSVDIVRCRECKYYNVDYTGEWCGRFRDPHGCRANAFCSYGERSEKPTGSADTQTYITDDRDTRILDAWQVEQMQSGKE